MTHILTSITDSIMLGMEHMTRSFDLDNDSLPWFDIRLRRELPAYMEHFPCFDGAHVPGRCLDALLFAEAVTGQTVTDTVIDTYRKHLMQSFDADDGLNGYIEPGTGKRTIVFHNFREGLLALHALARWRDDAGAKGTADRMLTSIHELANEDGSWKEDAIARLKERVDIYPEYISTATSGRLVGPLVKYYELTGNPLAADLAERFAGHALKTSFGHDGSLLEKAGRHIHSITSTISSLAEYFWLVKDFGKLARVKAIYDTGMKPWRSTFGWVKELTIHDHLGGEVNSTGDLMQAALIFAKAGYVESYSDAEMMLRGHLLPSQIRNEKQILDLWLFQKRDAKEDKWRDIAYRIRGGFGFPAPNDRAPLHYDNEYVRITTLDITGGSVQALCEAYRAAVQETDNIVYIHLLFDRTGRRFKFNQISAEQGRYAIEGDGSKTIAVRIPAGTFADQIRLEPAAAAEHVGLVEKKGYVHVQSTRPFRAVLVMPCSLFRVEEQLHGHVFTTKRYAEQTVSIEPQGVNSPIINFWEK